MGVDDVISRSEGLSDVQWLLRGGQPLALFQRILRGILLVPGSLGGCWREDG